MDKSLLMRELLGEHGIELDVDKPTLAPKAAPTNPVVNRDLVRSLLIRAGASARDIEWLVASCPSVMAAALYKPPRDLLARTNQPDTSEPVL